MDDVKINIFAKLFVQLVAKTACHAVKEQISEQLSPIQLGFGVKQACESAAHAARCYVQNMKPGQGFLKIDFTNAFNTIDRDEMFKTVSEWVPELVPFIDICYGQAT